MSRPHFLRPSLATRRLFVTEEPNTRIADTIMAVCAALGVITLLSFNVYEWGVDQGRREVAQTCPAGTAYSERYPDGKLKCIQYQAPMKKSRMEEARMRLAHRRAV